MSFSLLKVAIALLVFIKLVPAFSNVNDLRDASEVSCGTSATDVSPYSITKLIDAEYVTHLITINGDTLPLVMNEQESNASNLVFYFSVRSHLYERILVSGKNQEMTVFMRNAPVQQKLYCEVLYN